jgi:hypothetical protein
MKTNTRAEVRKIISWFSYIPRREKTRFREGQKRLRDRRNFDEKSKLSYVIMYVIMYAINVNTCAFLLKERSI